MGIIPIPSLRVFALCVGVFIKQSEDPLWGSSIGGAPLSITTTPSGGLVLGEHLLSAD